MKHDARKNAPPGGYARPRIAVPARLTGRCRMNGMASGPRYSPKMGRAEFERMLAGAVPGEIKARFVGATDNVLVHSVLPAEPETARAELHYVTYLELPPEGRDPEGWGPEVHDPDIWEQELSAGYVPPTGLGIAIRYQHGFADPFLAGKSYQQLATAMKHEIDHDEGDEPVIGREFIERKLQNEADRRLAELARGYERKTAECGDAPELAAELERRLHEQVPDEEKRELLRSLYSFTSDPSTGQNPTT